MKRFNKNVIRNLFDLRTSFDFLFFSFLRVYVYKPSQKSYILFYYFPVCKQFGDTSIY